MRFLDHDQRFEVKCITAINEAIKELGDINWEEALDTDSATFTDCEWVLVNLDYIANCTSERSWYYNTFEDNNTLFANWVEGWFGPLWAKIALNVEWN